MTKKINRIAINVGADFAPGMNAVVTGTTLAAEALGWEVVGIRDGFDALLHPEHHPDGGIVTLNRHVVENLNPTTGEVLGQSPRVDPFHVRRVDEDNIAEEVDMSDHLLKVLKKEKIDALISVVGGRGLSILYKLHRKGLNTVCIPRSVENDISSTTISFGFNSALSSAIDMLDRVRQAAKSTRRIAVVEVQGTQSGWLALQSAIAVGADAVLTPEIPYNIHKVAENLKQKMSPRRPYGLVVVAEGAREAQLPQENPTNSKSPSIKDSLSPLANGDSSEHVIRASGKAAEIVAQQLQRIIPEETYPLALGPWVRGGNPTAIDRQLALAYGAGAVDALHAGKNGVMVAFDAANIDFVPLSDAINKIRTVPAKSDFLQIARSLNICLGGEI